jgi:hypothetical protein
LAIFLDISRKLSEEPPYAQVPCWLEYRHVGQMDQLNFRRYWNVMTVAYRPADLAPPPLEMAAEYLRSFALQDCEASIRRRHGRKP